ncbi:LysR family transcriptional regulator [Pelagibius litoralis]|uniref:LysR family transcriptional regulator n=1 Tax=Pelagibius litoralis TaxID=374515 RepID=A0A967K8W5_9PROT|nr:LysR family transcriptional regulator [Pelagibius litoralis]NIA70678.1 LysR family transcriptional regulator [Pelagibius litoralis]
MNLSDLIIFRAVVEEGGITRAAERLHRVQSNVTTRVRQLEEDLGVALFIRQGKRLHLAPAGRVLLNYAERLLALAEEARDAVQDSRPRGTFRLGAMESTSAVRLPAPLSAYMKRYPEVDIELRTGNPEQLARAVLAGELDAALAAEPIAREQFDQIPVFEEDLVLIAGADQPPIVPGKPAPRRMIAFESGCPHRKRLEDWYAERGETPAQTLQLASYYAMLGCVLVGMGVTLLPKSVLATYPERKRLSLHPLPPGQDKAWTMLFWRKGADSPMITALAEILKTAASRKPKSTPPPTAP